MIYVYYSEEEYEPNKHKIINTFSDRNIGTAKDWTHPVIKIDEEYNAIAASIYGFDRFPEGLPPKYYVNNKAEIVDNDIGEVVTIVENPQKAAYKLSQLYGLTHGQLDNYINGLNTMADYKEAFRKLAHVTLYLIKQTKLDE